MPNQSPANTSPKTPKPDFKLIQDLRRRGYRRIVGIDEVGRGALAGPLVVAVVQIDQFITGINDSKQVRASLRRTLAEQINRQAEQIAVGLASNAEIDRLGLSRALRLAYDRALAKIKADLFLTDNYSLPGRPHFRAIKGDQFFYPTAAASIVAKVYRDQLMGVYHCFYPHFGWQTNVGYGTLFHRQNIERYGSSPLHRQLFLH